MPKKKSHTTPEQDKERFLNAAAELDCTMTGEEFETTVGKLSKVKPMTNSEVADRARGSKPDKE
jgi:hypothetical protein